MARRLSQSEMFSLLQSASTDEQAFDGPPDRTKLFDTLTEALSSKTYADVTLSARGHQVKAHRLVLHSQCTNLQGQLGASLDKPIDLNCDIEPLKRVLEYVYTNRVSIPQTDLKKVADVAEYLGVNDLRNVIRSSVLSSESVSFHNCLNMWAMAQDVENREIEVKARSFALDNFPKVKRTDSFKALPYIILEAYLSHSDLRTKGQEERLTSAMTWVKADSKIRVNKLAKLMDVLHLRSVSHGYLELLCEDPMIQDQPRILNRITDILDGIGNEDRQKADLEPDLNESCASLSRSLSRGSRERCLVFVGAHISGRESDEVKAIRLDHNLEVVTFGSIGATIPTIGNTSCCVKGDVLYTSGLGHEGDEVWEYNMAKRTSKLCARLTTPRSSHAMATTNSNGRVYVIGGHSPPGTRWSSTASIEALDSKSGTCSQVGELKHKDCIRLWCCSFQDQLLVCGAMDDQVTDTIQVYSIRKCRTTAVVPLPGVNGCDVYGAVQAKGHLIVIGQSYTAVCKVDDLQCGRKDSVCLSQNYITPNFDCGVAVSSDENLVFLLGGEPGEGYPQHYVYQAYTEDLLKDKRQGWVKVMVPWPLKGCQMLGGCDMADIFISS